MVAYSLEVNKDLFHFKEDNKEQFGLKHHLSAIGGLMYLVNCIKSNKSFFTNLLKRYSFASTRRHWSPMERSKYLLLAHILICHLPNDSIEIDNGSYFFNS